MSESDLVQCIYTSRLAAGYDDSELERILAKAKANNGPIGVTGMLLYEDGSFFQVLEGPRATVQKLYDKISKDRRHENVVKLIERPVTERDFGNWTMGVAQVTMADLRDLPGLNDFFTRGQSLSRLDEGQAKELLRAFRNGRYHLAAA
ncbi:MAG: BLUF domain-containing protein [Actinomycetota bacterium]